MQPTFAKVKCWRTTSADQPGCWVVLGDYLTTIDRAHGADLAMLDPPAQDTPTQRGSPNDLTQGEARKY
jgi:hypothetical protein